jgi:hypothetical protein
MPRGRRDLEPCPDDETTGLVRRQHTAAVDVAEPAGVDGGSDRLARDERNRATWAAADLHRVAVARRVVILPNIKVAALSGAFLTLAIVMGEFTITSLSAFHTFPTYLQQLNETTAYPAAAATLLSFGITWAAMLSILLVGRRSGQRAVVGIGR